MTTRDLPNLPRDITLYQAEMIVDAFGWELAIRPKQLPQPPRIPVGFAPSPEDYDAPQPM